LILIETWRSYRFMYKFRMNTNKGASLPLCLRDYGTHRWSVRLLSFRVQKQQTLPDRSGTWRWRQRVDTPTGVSNSNSYTRCQFSAFVAIFSDFSDPFSDIFLYKVTSDNLRDFWTNLSNLQMLPILSCWRELFSLSLSLPLRLPCSVIGWGAHGRWQTRMNSVFPRTYRLSAFLLFDI